MLLGGLVRWTTPFNPSVYAGQKGDFGDFGLLAVAFRSFGQGYRCSPATRTAILASAGYDSGLSAIGSEALGAENAQPRGRSFGERGMDYVNVCPVLVHYLN